MRVYLALLSHERCVTHDFVPHIHSCAENVLPFRIDDCSTAVQHAENDHISVFLWDNDTTANTEERVLQAHGGKVAVSSGYIRDGSSLKENVDEILHAEIVDNSTARRFGGLYSLLLADVEKGAVTAWNTIVNVEQVYWTKGEGCVCVGNHPVLVHLAATQKTMPEYDLSTFMPFLTAGIFAHDKMPFAGLNLLPANSILRVSPEEQCSVERIDDYTNWANPACREPDEAFYDELTEIFLDTIRSFGDLGKLIKLGLSGGRDSRLVAAALKHVGADFTTSTHGLPDDPNVILAKKVADVLDIDNEYLPTSSELKNPVVSADPVAVNVNALRVSGGVLRGFVVPDLTLSDRFAPSQYVHLSGGGGDELIRGGYALFMDPETDDEKQVREYLRHRYLSRAEYIRSPYREDYQRQYIDQWMQGAIGKNCYDVLDRAHLLFGFGRYACGIYKSATVNGRSKYWPYADAAFVKAARSVPVEKRVSEELIFEMMKRIAPQALLDLSFKDKRWNFERKGVSPLSPRGLAGWKRREPLSRAKAGRAWGDWRYMVGRELRDVFCDMILHNPKADALFNVLDRRKVESLFGEALIYKKNISRFLWNVLSASILVSNEWIRSGNNAKEQMIRVDYPWDAVDASLVGKLNGCYTNTTEKRAVNDERLIKNITKVLKLYFKNNKNEIKKTGWSANLDDALAEALAEGFFDTAKTLLDNELVRLASRANAVQTKFHVADAAWNEYLAAKMVSLGSGKVSLASLLERRTEVVGGLNDQLLQYARAYAALAQEPIREILKTGELKHVGTSLRSNGEPRVDSLNRAMLEAVLDGFHVKAVQ